MDRDDPKASGLHHADIPAAVWGAPFDAFLGPHAVDDGLYGFDGRAEDNAVHFDADPAPDDLWTSADGAYRVRAVADPDWSPAHTVLLLAADEGIVGFYAGGMVWIDAPHRGRGLAAPLILAGSVAAGKIPYDNRELLGFSEAGLAAHRAAHRLAVTTALAAGLPVPPDVAAEYLDQPSP